VRPANLSIKRESDTTRQVRLSWEYPGTVDILIHNGDANGYYVEGFSGATVVSGINGGTWLDTDAPSLHARYYRVRAVDTAQWAIDTAMKWDLGPLSGSLPYSFPAIPPFGENILSRLIGAQMAMGTDCYKFDPASGNLLKSEYDGNAWSEDFAYSNVDGFWLYAVGSAVATTVGLVGRDVSNIAVTAGGFAFWATGYSTPITLSSIGFVSAGAHAGTNKDNADNVDIVFDPASGTWPGFCWLSSDGHWYWNTTNSSCDGAQLLPGHGYWYQSRGTAFTFTIPKPYSNP